MRTILVASLAALCGLPAQDQTPNPQPRADEQRRDDGMAKDQTAVRQRPTAMDQGSSQSDIDTTARVRKALVDADDLSTTAENVLVVTRDGVVSIVGDIDEKEHQRVLQIARTASGTARIDDFINCCPKTGKPLYPANNELRSDRSAPMSDQDREYDRRIREVWAQDELVRDRVGDVHVSRTNGVLHITGTVPDEATRKRVIESLEQRADGHRISDGLTVGAAAVSNDRTGGNRGKQGNAGATDTTRPQDPADSANRQGGTDRTGNTGNTGGTGKTGTTGGTTGDAGKTGTTR